MRLIDADKLMERADEVTFMGFLAEERKKQFMDLVSVMLQGCPTIEAAPVEEFVQCMNCTRWKKDAPGCTDFVGRCEIANYMVGATGYCVYAKRKDK